MQYIIKLSYPDYKIVNNIMGFSMLNWIQPPVL